MGRFRKREADHAACDLPKEKNEERHEMIVRLLEPRPAVWG
jgi:hypothetical protein